MNVFVLCTGRSGSLSFTRACQHMTNFTAAHESRVPLLGDDRLAFPDNHIEVDCRLAWFLGRMDKSFGDTAFYVHLTRDPAKVAASWARRFYVLGGMATGYRDHILAGAATERRIGRTEAAADYVRTVTENIELFLKDKSHVMRFRLEDAGDQFPQFWEWIGAEGDMSAARNALAAGDDSERNRLRLKQRIHDFVQRGKRAYFPPK